MPIDLTTKFLPYVDEMFYKESKKSLLTNQDFQWDGAHAVKVYKVGTSKMNDYNREGTDNGNWSRYGAVAGLDATTETMTLRKDRSFTFAIDRLDQDETGDQLAAASALARQQREVIIPEVDAYVYGVMTAGAGSKPDALELTKANVYEEILKGSEVLGNAMVSETGRVLVVTPATYTLMKQCTDITMETDIGNDLRLKGVISMLDGMDVVRVPASRLPADFGFLIAHPCATVAPTKLESYKAHEDPPGISGSLVEGRITYDAFVLDNKTKAIYYQRGGLVLTSAAGTATGATKVTVSTTKGKGNSYKYKVDAAVPVAGADCSAWTDWNGTAHYNRLEYLAELQETLEGLRRSAQPRTQAFTGMPHAGGISDRVGDLAVEIADMEAEIKALQEEIAVHEATILSFIQSIPDPRTRTIFHLRFLRGLQWKEVAGAIGGRNSISAVKATCYRFIQKRGEGAKSGSV